MTRAGATTFGSVLGTVGYMSPEQASGRPVDYRSDQFALGLLIYELVTRMRPFERATTAQSLAATIDDDPAPIETLHPDVPPHLAAVVARCLAKDPAERYESTRDLARDLKSIEESSTRQHRRGSRSIAIDFEARRRHRGRSCADRGRGVGGLVVAEPAGRQASPSASVR